MASESTYWIALRAVNSSGTWSRLSNVVSVSLRANAVVEFPDPSLEALIRDIIHEPSGEIRSLDLVGVTEVAGDDRGITDLTGLEACVNLRFLHLGNNGIAELTPLAGLLQLQGLGLWANQITDLAPLADLVSLIQLSLGSNQITGIRPLQYMRKLDMLSLSNNQISDIGYLGQMKDLTTLTVNNNLLDNIVVLSGLTNLQYVQLDRNRIIYLYPLVDNPGIGGGDEVFVRNNPLSEEAIEEQITALQARGVTVHW